MLFFRLEKYFLIVSHIQRESCLRLPRAGIEEFVPMGSRLTCHDPYTRAVAIASAIQAVSSVLAMVEMTTAEKIHTKKTYEKKKFFIVFFRFSDSVGPKGDRNKAMIAAGTNVSKLNNRNTIAPVKAAISTTLARELRSNVGEYSIWK